MRIPRIKLIGRIRPTNNIESFIDYSSKIHKNKYGYSLIKEIKTGKDMVDIICPVHGPFKQAVRGHLDGLECRKCGWLKTRVTLEDVINRAKAVHGDTYDYTDAKLIHGKDATLTLRCRVHGEFTQRVDGHLRYGCDRCAKDAFKLSNNDFLKRSKDIHGDTYDYSLVKYNGNLNKVDILCKKHGKFEQRPYDHYRGNGCPKCKISHGERLIGLFLKENNIEYKSEYQIANTVYRYDFYIPEINLLIEYDGQLHYNVEKFHGGSKRLQYHIKLDKLKDALSEEQGYLLLRIHYKDYRDVQKIIIEYINNIYPYRYNNKFYRNKEQLLEQIDIEPNAIDSILDKHKTYLVLQELTFSVKLKHNVKKRKRKSQLK